MKRFVEATYENGELIIRVPFSVAAKLGSADVSQPTQRERQVLEMIRRALTNKEIAKSLGISERTVKSHVSALLRKFDCETRAELVYKFQLNSSREGT